MKKDKKSYVTIFVLPGNLGIDCKGNGSYFTEDGFLIKCYCDNCEFLKCCSDATYPECCNGCTISCPRHFLNETMSKLLGCGAESVEQYKNRLDKILKSNKNQ